ncbi:MAG: serine/threonine protein kinase [Prevotella sp.]|nr:serine/threonine protein kinase [Prevotella sp.]
MNDLFDSSDSGYIIDSFEGISRTFTDMEIIHESEINVVAKAKRYGRWWLLKSLRPELAQQENFRQRLRKEFELMTQLQHPAIVTVVGLESVDGLGECIVMEYVEGQTLATVLAKRNTLLHQRRRMAEELLEAVKHIHAKGIIHRDLKPSNIMVTANGGHIKLVDFGLADSDSHCVFKQPAGTPKYMSPEQKQYSKADVRNDIYSLGIILGQMNLGGIYQKVIKRCLRPAEERYQNVDEIRDDIQRFKKRRMRMLFFTISLPFLLLMATVGWMAWQWHIQRQITQSQQMLLESQDKEMDAQRIKMTILEEETRLAKNEQSAQRKTVKKLTDSLTILTNENIRMQEKEKVESERKQRIDDAKQKGFLVVDEAMWKFGTMIYKEINPEMYIGIVENNAVLDKAKIKYQETLRGKFEENEIVEIMIALNQHQKDLASKKWKTVIR